MCEANFSFSYSKLTPSFAVQRQKEFELAEFKMLHSEEGGERDQGGDRCRSSCPFFDQLPCVCQVLLDCCMVQGLGGLGLWKGKRAARVCIQRHSVKSDHITPLFRPINNRSIVVQRPHGLALRPHTDHFKFSEDIWSM